MYMCGCKISYAWDGKKEAINTAHTANEEHSILEGLL